MSQADGLPDDLPAGKGCRHPYEERKSHLPSFRNGGLSLEQVAEFKKFHGQPVTHFPRAVLRHDPGKLKTFADLFRQRVRWDDFCESDRNPCTVKRINEESFNLL